jgi:hypothetical protein
MPKQALRDCLIYKTRLTKAAGYLMKNQIIVKTLLIVFGFGYSLLTAEAQTPQNTPEEKQEKTEDKPPEQLEEKPAPTPDDKTKKKCSFTYGGELTNYFISQSNPFFGEQEKNWLETSLRLDGTFNYKNFTAGISGSLSDEITFVGEWYPRDNLWFNVVLGASVPRKALAPSGLGNSFAFLNSGAAQVGTKTSFDMVFATCWRF